MKFLVAICLLVAAVTAGEVREKRGILSGGGLGYGGYSGIGGYSGYSGIGGYRGYSGIGGYGGYSGIGGYGVYSAPAARVVAVNRVIAPSYGGAYLGGGYGAGYANGWW